MNFVQNATRNLNQTMTTADTTVSIVLLVIAVPILMVNVWVILSIGFCRSLHSVSNYFLANLCAANILTAGFLCLMSAIFTFDTPRTYSVTIIAVAFSWALLQLCSYFLSSVIVSVDRYYKVTHPMQYLRLVTTKVCAVTIAVMWTIVTVLGIVFFVVSWLNFQVYHPFVSEQELLSNTAQLKTAVIIACVVSFPCMTLLTGLIIGLLRIARQQQLRVRDEAIMLAHLHDNSIDNNPRAGHPHRRQHNHRATCHLIVHFNTFILAWGPLSLMNIVIYLAPNITPDPLIIITVYSVSFCQTVFGTLFLIYTQKEHRKVLCDAFNRLRHAFK